MSLSVKGTIKQILPIESGTSKAGKDWKKQHFILDTGDQYNPNLCFSLFGDDKIQIISKFEPGQEVEVYFNLSSREYNGKWFHNVDAWKVEALSQEQANQSSPPPPSEEPAEPLYSNFKDEEEADDLPF